VATANELAGNKFNITQVNYSFTAMQRDYGAYEQHAGNSKPSKASYKFFPETEAHTCTQQTHSPAVLSRYMQL